MRTIEVNAPRERVIDDVAAFFKERSPQLNVKTIGSTTASVEVRYDLLDDWTRLVHRHAAVTFAWRPRFWAFPRFGAMLTVRPHGAGSILVLEGQYTPPGGALGRLFDRMIAERLANGTMDELLHDIKQYIGDRSSGA
jgi:hypothetical protein